MEKRTRKAWTEDEERAFELILSTHYYNLSEAFRIHAEKTGRTENAVHFHYYTITRFRKKHFVFMGIGSIYNGKNWKPGFKVNPEPCTNKVLNAVIKALGPLF